MGKAQIYVPETPNYGIDQNLKPGLHYPEVLQILFAFFISRRNPDIGAASKKLNRKFERNLVLVEKSFRDYFLLSSYSIHTSIIRRINARLKNLHPELQRNVSGGYSLKPVVVNLDKDFLAEGRIWSLLADVIDSEKGLNKNLVHECPYCEKIFIARRGKRFHSFCRSKYFSEKYTNEGIAARRQKEYRERLKKKSKNPKKA
ncbi:MAG: hypothetical protein V2B13_16240 [Pseudomonadota bacterium]